MLGPKFLRGSQGANKPKVGARPLPLAATMLLSKLKWLFNRSSGCAGGFFENVDAIRNVIGWSQVLFKTEVPQPLLIFRAILIYADLWVDTSVNTYLVSSSVTVVALRLVGLPYHPASSHLNPQSHPSPTPPHSVTAKCDCRFKDGRALAHRAAAQRWPSSGWPSLRQLRWPTTG